MQVVQPVHSAFAAGQTICWHQFKGSHLMQGHKIKNAKTKIAQQLRDVPVAVAVIISGTPIQNNLMELFVLFDFVCPVRLTSQECNLWCS